MERAAGLAALLIVGIGAYLYSRTSQALQYTTFSDIEYAPQDAMFYSPESLYSEPYTPADPYFDPGYNDDSPLSELEEMIAPLKPELARDWRINEYPKYAVFIRETEDRNGIPRDLLARQLAKETGNFRADIIRGDKVSPVGAMGIAQFMPATGIEYGLLPGRGPGSRDDPIPSIAAAGKYMRNLYRMFNSWRYALAAYNWGPGNVQKWLRGEVRGDGTPWQPPAETRDYLASITADVPVA